jgi:hypothetical protein
MNVLWILAEIVFSIATAIVIIFVTTKVFDRIYNRVDEAKRFIPSSNYEHMVVKSLSVNSIMACLEADLYDAVHIRDKVQS